MANPNLTPEELAYLKGAIEMAIKSAERAYNNAVKMGKGNTARVMAQDIEALNNLKRKYQA